MIQYRKMELNKKMDSLKKSQTGENFKMNEKLKNLKKERLEESFRTDLMQPKTECQAIKTMQKTIYQSIEENDKSKTTATHLRTKQPGTLKH